MNTTTQPIQTKLDGVANGPASLAVLQHAMSQCRSEKDGADPACPQCGTQCDHTPEEMQGFALDALQNASEGLARDEAACARANAAAKLGNQAVELRNAPPAAFIGLENDGTVREWFRMLSDSSTNHKMRKHLVRQLRDLITACATEQRTAAVATLYEQAASGQWLRVEQGLPAPYEEVRILVDGCARIARLAYCKTHFQYANFNGSAKNQYVVSIDKVAGWQPLMAPPGQI